MGDSEDQETVATPAGAIKISGWKKASAVGFKTLRDMLPHDSIIDATQLKVKHSLGEGAFAYVNLAELGTGRLVAVKTLKPELLENPKDVKLFLKETELMRKIRHPAIVDLIGVGGKIDPSGSENFLDLYIVQEYCSGGSLRDIVYKQMTTNKKFLYTQADALRWCINIAKALHYLHSAKPKVIHRDLKLENVILTDPKPSSANAKLADFGLAKLMASSQKGQQRQQELHTLASKSAAQLGPLERTRSLSVKKVMQSLDSLSWRNSSLSETAIPSGFAFNSFSSAPANAFASDSITIPEDEESTPGAPHPHGGTDMTGEAGSYSYMAPEVLRGSQYDEKADIFSFAMLMYNLFYRVIPSVLLVANGGQPEDMPMLAWETANGYRPKLSDTGTIPASVNAVINECWSGVPELRPSAGELVKKLLEIQNSGVCKGSAGGSANGNGNAAKIGGKDTASGGCACAIM